MAASPEVDPARRSILAPVPVPAPRRRRHDGLFGFVKRGQSRLLSRPSAADRSLPRLAPGLADARGGAFDPAHPVRHRRRARRGLPEAFGRPRSRPPCSRDALA